GDSVNLTASASSGLPVRFVSTTQNVCTTSGTTAVMIGVGTCFLEAKQAGDDNYTAAVALQNFTVNRASQTIRFTGIPSEGTYGAAGPYRLFATASSGLPVSFSATGPANINGSTLTITGEGTIVVTASQSGSVNYGAATSVSQTIVIRAATQNDILNA